MNDQCKNCDGKGVITTVLSEYGGYTRGKTSRCQHCSPPKKKNEKDLTLDNILKEISRLGLEAEKYKKSLNIKPLYAIIDEETTQANQKYIDRIDEIIKHAEKKEGQHVDFAAEIELSEIIDINEPIVNVPIFDLESLKAYEGVYPSSTSHKAYAININLRQGNPPEAKRKTILLRRIFGHLVRNEAEGYQDPVVIIRLKPRLEVYKDMTRRDDSPQRNDIIEFYTRFSVVEREFLSTMTTDFDNWIVDVEGETR